MTRVALANARLFDPATGRDTPGGLLIVDGRIADLGPALFADGVPEGAEAIDCAGRLLVPGLIDMRAQLREPGNEHQENMATASQAAVAGGITTIVCLPNTDPVIDDVALVEFVRRRGRDIGLAHIHPYAAATKGLAGKELTEMGLLAEAGAVGFTDGTRAIANAGIMRRALSYARTFDLLLVQHPEEPTLSHPGGMNEGEIATRLGLPGIPAMAEVVLLERDLRLVELTGARYHAAHLSTAGAVEAIRDAKRRGLPVTCDTAPPYFALNETAVGDYRTFAKLSPPLRSDGDRRAIVAGIADGTIDAIASDHAPHDQDSKRLPFSSAASGIIGLETLLPLVLELAHQGDVPLARALAAVTAAPAGILGLDCGRLAVGAPADLTLIDLDRPWRIAVDRFRSKSKNSPFDGRPVQGRAAMTMLGGRVVHRVAD
ncbi:dihydroorotase [Stella humosa]|uniref:Dihydroorotase n=1 Tax=Stella humosa TaxID=94 RepID=A0A3N1KPG7_9PROT|nr:dihydroorotase [Stella humosa]ROP81182.1 dihydroorotase [Stella humosa]BBK32528.1 dihydroorotase [Stella humosa]